MGSSFDAAGYDSGPPPVAFEIRPQDAVLFIDTSSGSPKPATADYRVSLVTVGSPPTYEDVAASFTIDDTSLGSFVGPKFTSVAGLPAGRSIDSTVVHAVGAFGVAFTGLHLVQLDTTRESFFRVSYHAPPSPERIVVRMISGSTTLDLTIAISAEPNPDDIDTTVLIEKVRAMGEGDTKTGCGARTTKDQNGDGVDDMFPAVEPGALVCFEVTARTNDSVKPFCFEPQFLGAFLDLVGLPDKTKIERHRLLFFIRGDGPCPK